MPGLCRLGYGTSTERPSPGLGVFSAVAAVVTRPLSEKWVCAGRHIDTNLLHPIGDEIMDVKVL